MDLDETLSWPFFDDGHRRFAQALTRWADATLPALPHDDVDAACRARVKALAEAGFPQGCRCRPSTAGCIRGSMCARSAWRAEILAFRDGLADFAFAMQGLGTGSISLFGTAELAGALSAAGARRPRHRRLRAVGAGGRLRRCGAGHHRHAGRAVASAHRRREDLDLQRRHRRSLRRFRAHRRRRRRQGALGVRRRCRHRRPAGDRAHRRDRAASAGNAAVRGRAGAADPSPGQAGGRLQGRHGDARRVPLDRRRRGARLRPPGVARDRRARRRAAGCSARRSAICR